MPGAGVLSEAEEVLYLAADFARLTDVSQAVTAIRSRHNQIDVLINNAATPGAPTRTLTVDGNERTLQVNLLAPSLLTNGLLTLLRPDRQRRLCSAPVRRPRPGRP